MTRKEALAYIRNTDGNATVAHFIDDWEPVGRMEWKALLDSGLAVERDGKIFLTEKGETTLKSQERNR